MTKHQEFIMPLSKNQKLKVLRRLEKINQELDESEMLDGLDTIFKQVVRAVKEQEREDENSKIWIPKYYYSVYCREPGMDIRQDIIYLKHENNRGLDSEKIKRLANSYLTAKEARQAGTRVWEALCQ